VVEKTLESLFKVIFLQAFLNLSQFKSDEIKTLQKVWDIHLSKVVQFRLKKVGLGPPKFFEGTGNERLYVLHEISGTALKRILLTFSFKLNLIKVLKKVNSFPFVVFYLSDRAVNGK
jgi:hypothetical protein